MKSMQSQTIAPETTLITPSGMLEIIMNGMQMKRFFVNQPTMRVNMLAIKPLMQETIMSVLYSYFLKSFGMNTIAPNIPTAAQIWITS